MTGFVTDFRHYRPCDVPSWLQFPVHVVHNIRLYHTNHCQQHEVNPVKLETFLHLKRSRVKLYLYYNLNFTWTFTTLEDFEFCVQLQCERAVADLGGRPGAPPMIQNFLNFMQFFAEIGKIICWRPLEGWRPLLRGILDPPLLSFKLIPKLSVLILTVHWIFSVWKFVQLVKAKSYHQYEFKLLTSTCSSKRPLIVRKETTSRF